jgi:hypothetical protein
MTREFDGPCKYALELYFETFVQVFFPELFELVDWEQGYRPLDTELQTVLEDVSPGKILADRLFEVKLKSGLEVWLLIHIEIQSQKDVELPQRMFEYRYWIARRFGKPVKSIAILGDDDPTWRPVEYRVESFGNLLVFRYDAIKLLDYEGRDDDLVRHPIGFAILAHLISLRCKDDDRRRMEEKFALIRQVYHRGVQSGDIKRLYKIVDWLLQLPNEFRPEWEIKMSALRVVSEPDYMTHYEQDGYDRGIRQGMQNSEIHASIKAILFGMDLLYGTPSESLSSRISEIRDPAILEQLLAALKRRSSIEVFTALLPE